MKRSAALATLCMLLLALIARAPAEQDGQVEVVRLTPENWTRFAPAGKEVDAIAGDLVLRNQHLIAVIAEPLATRHANMTVRDVGGALIDLAVRESPSDQLSAFYPGRRQFPFRSVRVLGEAGAPLRRLPHSSWPRRTDRLSTGTTT